MTSGHLTEYSWNAPIGTRDTREILFRQRHDMYRVFFNVYPGETAKLEVNSTEQRPPPYQRHTATPHQNPHATFPDKAIPENMIKKRLWFDEVISYVIASLTSIEYMARKGVFTEGHHHSSGAPVWIFWGPLTIGIIWELIPIALLYFYGVPPPPSANLPLSVYTVFLSGASITFLWTLPLEYCTVCWFIFGFPLGLLIYGHRCLMNALHALEISGNLSDGLKCMILGRFYQGDKHCIIFFFYSCLSLVCAVYAYWGSFRYLLPVTVLIIQ